MAGIYGTSGKPRSPWDSLPNLDDNQEQKRSSQGPFRGIFGRLIAVIYVKVDGQWVNVNAELLKWGPEEYPDQEWLRFTYFISEFDADEWLEENYPYLYSKK